MKKLFLTITTLFLGLFTIVSCDTKPKVNPDKVKEPETTQGNENKQENTDKKKEDNTNDKTEENQSSNNSETNEDNKTSEDNIDYSNESGKTEFISFFKENYDNRPVNNFLKLEQFFPLDFLKPVNNSNYDIKENTSPSELPNNGLGEGIYDFISSSYYFYDYSFSTLSKIFPLEELEKALKKISFETTEELKGTFDFSKEGSNVNVSFYKTNQKIISDVILKKSSDDNYSIKITYDLENNYKEIITKSEDDEYIYKMFNNQVEIARRSSDITKNIKMFKENNIIKGFFKEESSTNGYPFYKTSSFSGFLIENNYLYFIRDVENVVRYSEYHNDVKSNTKLIEINNLSNGKLLGVKEINKEGKYYYFNLYDVINLHSIKYKYQSNDFVSRESFYINNKNFEYNSFNSGFVIKYRKFSNPSYTNGYETYSTIMFKVQGDYLDSYIANDTSTNNTSLKINIKEEDLAKIKDENGFLEQYLENNK